MRSGGPFVVSLRRIRAESSIVPVVLFARLKGRWAMVRQNARMDRSSEW